MFELLREKTEHFIDGYKHYYYCEIIIYPNGDIEEAIPSHVETLIRITGKSKDELREIIPVEDQFFPLQWLVENTKCVAVWYEGYKGPAMLSEEQRIVLNMLGDAKKVVNKSMGG